MTVTIFVNNKLWLLSLFYHLVIWAIHLVASTSVINLLSKPVWQSQQFDADSRRENAYMCLCLSFPDLYGDSQYLN
ncbi:hypothetical protein BX070DRAFT_221607 [Coemansia spiralis]|nr:hypothetical protein BX070DRAFT_221607 [Coemansia spiralis]